MIKKTTLLLPLIALGVGAAFMASSSCSKSEAKTISSKKKDRLKVLYITHEPGTYHAYTPQRKIFEGLAEKNNWNLIVKSGSYQEVEKMLATTPDFGKGADVIVYNICMANCSNLEVPHNIIQQTKVKGTPSLLIHCSLHSFWPTFKHGDTNVHGQPAQVKTKSELVAKWKESHPNDDFPSWATFTGIASSAHGPRAPLNTKVLKADHEVFKNFEDYTAADHAELYNNFVKPEQSPETTSLLEGDQNGNKAVIMWEHPVGKSKTLSFTLGHDEKEWSQPQFQKLITNSVNYLGKDDK